MKRLFTILCFCLVVATSQPASATIPVLDYSNLMQALLNYMSQIQQYTTLANQYATQLRQLANQYQQLQNEAQNLKNLNYLLDVAGLDDLQQIMLKAQGIANDYARLQQTFNNQYPDFARYNTMSGRDYAGYAIKWNQEVYTNTKAAMDVQANMKNSFVQDKNAISDLRTRTALVQGSRDGLQNIANIALLQAKQLAQLQQLMASSQRAESAYMAERASGEAAAKAKKDNLYRDWSKKGSRTVNTNIDKLH
ncbi:P-type conjugative transfer protein TrbJ [Geobacter grbiciae]|uniref:P-type conjugative transfer protein TrbJ n=1 Tax=Geobacter grbiciae TaxID=155042 RepID=UPI001C020D98|nr:P-type conjugative transfer protein TrbJ [Geobacter grbiciae]MBT1077215.1 P-type conjugative transfer protein TrbJ [Geobacter grbiciae]